MPRKWTAYEVSKLREYFDVGIPDADIAKKFGRSTTSVKVKRKMLGITGDPHARRISVSGRLRMSTKPTGSDSPSWKGGRRTNHNGYVEIFLPDHPRARGNGYVFEHILVAEQKLGRPLLPSEVVHHIDREKPNNDPKNIEVHTRGNHTRIHLPRKRRIECPASINVSCLEI
jgi:hypothetical protein